MIKQFLFSLTLICLLVACNTGGDHDIFKPGNESSSTPPATTRFDLLTPQQTGINFVAQIKDELKYNFLADPYIYNGGGVSVIDVNNDGLQDLFFTARLQGCRLYLNKGNFKFEDISEPSGVSKFSGLKTGTVVVDINADGWQDIYVCRTWLTPVPERRNLLFINNKDNTFSEQAAAFQLDDLSASQHANFFDYDRDGDLDCYVVNHPVDFKTINNLDQGKQAGRPGMPKNEWESDRFYRNDGGKFTDLTTAAGLQNRAFGLSTLAADFNHDGWPDLFVGNDFVMPDFLYINNQNGTFTDRAAEYFKHTSNHTMGVDYADLNNDGLSDLIALDMLAEPLDRRLRLLNTMQRTRDQQMITNGYGKQVMRNVVQLNNGNLPFSEIGCLTGMYATEWSWAPLIADYDHDGNQDVFISNGIQRDLNDEDFFAYTADSINATGGVSASRFPDFSKFVDMVPSKPVHNYMFQNLGGLEFSNVSSSWGFTKEGFSNGAVYADLDNDGDLDLVTNNLQAPPSVYENKCVGTNKNNWLQIKCKGTAQNPFGIGAKIKVFDANNVLILAQEMTNVRGFYSSVEPIIQVGLGNQTASKIEIEWLEGRHQELVQQFVNQRIILDIQQASVGDRTPALPTAKKLWEATPALEGLKFIHQENQFEDFDREKLLPYRFSRRGPCSAVGDLDQNGTEDIYFGGASGQTG
ncbi:MAG: CRTAC1 family protein, partial [Saprospiraceae bacterium]|nr:CRTAC1 family protein [Saprospiraceae bacterium]